MNTSLLLNTVPCFESTCRYTGWVHHSFSFVSAQYTGAWWQPADNVPRINGQSSHKEPTVSIRRAIRRQWLMPTPDGISVVTLQQYCSISLQYVLCRNRPSVLALLLDRFWLKFILKTYSFNTTAFWDVTPCKQINWKTKNWNRRNQKRNQKCKTKNLNQKFWRITLTPKQTT